MPFLYSGGDKKSSVADSDPIGSTTFDRIRIHYFKGGSEDPDPLFPKGRTEDPDPLFPNVDPRIQIHFNTEKAPKPVACVP